MKSVLQKCNQEDIEYISQVLDNYASFTDDTKRKELVKDYRILHPINRKELITLLDKQIRYFGSSDIAYLFRSIFNNEGGVSAIELINDVYKKMKIPLKNSSSVEFLLERLAISVVDKELASKKPEELYKAFKEMGITDQESKLLLSYMKENGSIIVLPIIFKLLGQKAAMKIVENVLVSVISSFLGATVGRQVATEILKKNPLINMLGPVVWVVSGTWVIYDIQGPAFRKTIPICLYLGIVSLRDGLEKKSFLDKK